MATTDRSQPRRDRSAVVAASGYWLVVAAIGGYLTYETGRYRLGSTPLPILGWAFLLPLLVVARMAQGRNPSRPSARRLAAMSVTVLVAIAVVTLVVVRLGHVHVRVNDRVLEDAWTQLTDRILDARLFGGPIVVPVLLAIVGVIAAVLGTRRRTHVTPTIALTVMAFTWFVMSDLVLFQSVGLRDLRLDLRAGAEFLRGNNVYLTSPLTLPPADPTMLPFLYPPVTLPVFGLLSQVPFWLVGPAWFIGSALAAIAALRCFGVTWRWSLALLLWPGFAEGLYVGNVAIPALLAFAVGPWIGAALVVGGIFKLQAGIPSLWLLREGRVRGFVIGVGALLVLVALTLPLTGVQAWTEWIDGLRNYAASQSAVPALYGFALPGFVPYPVYVALAALAVAFAFLARSRESLARFGVATVVASPSLFTHGFLTAIPALLGLRTFWLWASLALTASVLGGGWWFAILIALAARLLPFMRRVSDETDALQPLGAAPTPWSRPPLPANIPWRLPGTTSGLGRPVD
jgi:hypothetical protein